VACGLPHLKRRADYLRVSRKGKACTVPGLVLQAYWRREAADRPELVGMMRLGITASRKVGNAVARNRSRRRLRAAAGEVLTVHAQPGYDYVIIARGASLTRPFPALIGDLTAALRRLGLYRLGDGVPAGERNPCAS
jgi:ribonuclease P protein component